MKNFDLLLFNVDKVTFWLVTTLDSVRQSLRSRKPAAHPKTDFLPWCRLTDRDEVTDACLKTFYIWLNWQELLEMFVLDLINKRNQK